MILSFQGRTPRLAADAWVQETARVIGDVEIGRESSIWFHTVVRADVDRIRIGDRTNVQDLCTLHVTRERWPTLLGHDVTIGHRAVVHGCTVGDFSLIGIGAVVLDGAEIGSEVLVGASALVVPGMKIPPRKLVLGSPARIVRDLKAEEIEHLHRSAANYVEYARRYREQGL